MVSDKLRWTAALVLHDEYRTLLCDMTIAHVHTCEDNCKASFTIWVLFWNVGAVSHV